MLVQPGQFLAHDLVRAAKRVVAGARQYDVMRVSAAKRLEQRNLRRLNGERGIEFPPKSAVAQSVAEFNPRNSGATAYRPDSRHPSAVWPCAFVDPLQCALRIFQ
jgi:hypothetical protein